MPSVACYGEWQLLTSIKQFSLRGRKAKKAFQDLTICRVITAAFQKNFPAVTAAETEDLIGQVLKFAPHRRPAEKG
ncbi:hypothetical protein R3I94_017858 [Phoxinus phoxinus]